MIIKLFTLDGANRKADKSITLRMTTAIEQTSQDMLEFDLLHQRHILVAIKEDDTPFLDAEIKDLDSVDLDLEDTTKTPSARLRSSLWRWCESSLNRAPTKEEFKDFYKTKMEILIEHVKSKIQ